MEVVGWGTKFHRGDRVECNRIGYEGTGTIVDISTDVEVGGSKLYPRFLVRLDDGPETWYNGVSLTYTEY